MFSSVISAASGSSGSIIAPILPGRNANNILAPGNGVWYHGKSKQGEAL
jgi:hypothetical protein